jgi:hypothetical protein
MSNLIEITIIGSNNVRYLVQGQNANSCINGYHNYLRGKRQRALRGRSLVRSLGGGDAA